MMLLLSKSGLLRGKVGWLRAGLSGVETGGVGPKLRPETRTSIGMGDSPWDERIFEICL